MLFHVRFWTSVLRNRRAGLISIWAGDQSIEIATVPALIQQSNGIEGDQKDLLRLLDEEAPLIAAEEEENADYATAESLSGEPAEDDIEAEEFEGDMVEVADRILHDRQLCSFIARTVMEIGFDGETIEGLRSQWVKRETWPVRVMAVLNARDRGKRWACGADIVHELDADGHIDHIYAISQGGCNDLVNLQLLCSSCNQKKRARSEEVATSVPQNIRRAKTPQDRAQ